MVKSLPCRIERMHRLAPEVMAVFLRLPANEEFHFFAGQYLDIMLPQNRRRSFSIASCPGRDELIELHIRKVASGEFTQQLFDGMKEKTLLRIEGPLGQFWFRRESPRPALLIGGGTGYAPLRSMLRDLLAVGDRRPLHLYWGAQTRQDLYEDEQVRALSAAHPNLRYTPVLSDSATARRLDRPARPRARGGARRSSRSCRTSTCMRAARRRWSKPCATSSSSAACRRSSCSSIPSTTRRTRSRKLGR